MDRLREILKIAKEQDWIFHFESLTVAKDKNSNTTVG
jgi:hypothetical protein